MADLKIGVLAIQGDFLEHAYRLKQAAGKLQHLTAITVVEVRNEVQLQDLDGLILPGGESTTLSYFFDRYELLEPLRKLVLAEKRPIVWGTCAGLIALSDRVLDAADNQKIIGGLGIESRRNHYGSQVQSFQSPLTLSNDLVTSVASCTTGDNRASTFPGVFIRAPLIVTLVSETARPLATISVAGSQQVVAVEQGKLIGATFHPELTSDTRLHEYFLLRCIQNK